MTRFRRLLHAQELDYVVAGLLVVLAQVELWFGHAVDAPMAVAVALALVMTGGVALRRRRPLGVGSAVLLANGVLVLVAGPHESVALTVSWMCALYALAVWTQTAGFLVGLGLLAAMNAMDAFAPGLDLRNSVFFTVVPGIAMLILRRSVRDRQLLTETLAARAELLEREQQLRADQAVAEERARIARELHDLVAHNVSVMVVQAGAERHALSDEQASTREVLTSIEQAGRQALTEARRLLGMLRRNGDHEDLAPQPTIAHVDALVEQVQRAGLPVTLAIEGDQVSLPAGVDLCAYRIVQEALTNALKHAGPARAEVRLRYTPRGLDVEIRDDGRGLVKPNRHGAGHGLIGMRERVALYGGTLAAGPSQDGGYEVRAHLPIA
jgi:signal transduction histidine kinase